MKKEFYEARDYIKTMKFKGTREASFFEIIVHLI